MTSTLRSLLAICSALTSIGSADAAPTTAEAIAALRKAVTYFHQHVAVHGGYVYHCTLDLQTRWGEGLATADQIWVQPPGTPTVGMAFLEAYAATGDSKDLQAATDAAVALIYGQLQSGGWQNCVDFNPRGERVNLYRNGKGGGKNNSSLDDGQSSTALLFLVKADEAHHFQHHAIHEAALIGLNALLAAQYPNGAFPQVWTGPVSPQPVKPASFPEYDWRTAGRVKEYWTAYTLNDNVAGYVARTLIEAHRVYQDPKYLAPLQRLGDFLILAQMPQPQRGWAQQYSFDMQPIWARKFEPPGVSGDESQEVIETLLLIHAATRDDKYLQPIPEALDWLTKSELPDGQLARYYELQTNRPMYMTRTGDAYSLTYDDTNLPDHYGWKTASRRTELHAAYEAARSGKPASKASSPSSRELDRDVQQVLAELDAEGRWVSTYNGERLVGQPKFRTGDRYLSSEVFSRNLTQLSTYIRARRASR